MDMQEKPRTWSDVHRLVNDCRSLVDGAAMTMQALGRDQNAEIIWSAMLEVRGRLQRANADFQDAGLKRSER